MNKKIMILGASILQLPAIRQAKALGYQVVVVDMNPNAVGFEEDNIEKEVISTIDVEAVMNAAKQHKIDGIMTLASDMPMRTVAAVSYELGLVGIDMDTAIKATNKAEMRNALLKNGVPVPKFFKVSNKKEYYETVAEFTKPFIVKPADNSGSRGIIKVADLEDKILIENAYNYSKASSRNGDLVVEEFMDGPEVSVETLTVDGVCHVIQVTDKLTTGAPHFVEMGHSQPSRLSNDVIDRIKEVAIAANKAIGINNGPSHTEIIVTKEGPKIVELGARLGGDCITTHLVPLSTGVNMVECCIRIALGEKPSFDALFNKGAAIRYFNCNEGVIKKIYGIDLVKQNSGVKEIVFTKKVGDKVNIINSSSERVGFVISQGKSANEAISIAEEALNNIKIIVE